MVSGQLQNFATSFPGGLINICMALGFTQPLTEIFPGYKALLVHKADNLSAIYEPNV
jgi:hypothetical protein